MVAEGKLTPEEADALLEALEEEVGSPKAGDASGASGRKPETSWRRSEDAGRDRGTERPRSYAEQLLGGDLNKLGSTLEEVLDRVRDELKQLPEQLSRLAIDKGGWFWNLSGHREVIRCHRRQAWPASSGPVKVVNARGDVTIDTWDEDAVDVEAELVVSGDLSDEGRYALQEAGVTLEVRDDALLVRAFDASPYRVWGVRLAGADVRVRVPRGVSVDVSSIHGDVEARGDLGEVRAEAVHGDLELSGGRSRLKASTRNGDISINRFEGQGLEIDSTHGDVSLLATATSIRVNTVRGDVKLTVRGCREARVDTVSGDVEVQAELESGATCEVHTVHGNADVSVKVDGGLQVSLEAASGDVECLLPLDQVQKGRRSLSGSRGDGATRVRLTSMHGDLTLR